MATRHTVHQQNSHRILPFCQRQYPFQHCSPSTAEREEQVEWCFCPPVRTDLSPAPSSSACHLLGQCGTPSRQRGQLQKPSFRYGLVGGWVRKIPSARMQVALKCNSCAQASTDTTNAETAGNPRNGMVRDPLTTPRVNSVQRSARFWCPLALPLRCPVRRSARRLSLPLLECSSCPAVSSAAALY